MAGTSSHRGKASRERILQAATELFARHGYAGTSVDRLARRSGIAKTAIYHHFGSKERLLAAVLEQAATTWIEGISQAARQSGEPGDRLDRALAGMRLLLEEKPWILNLLQILALEVAGERPEVRATLQAIVQRAKGAIVSGMRDVLGIDLPRADAVAGAILALLDGVALGRLIDPDGISLDEAFAEIRRITTFMVLIRLDPDLGRRFDEPVFEHQPGRPAAARGGEQPAERGDDDRSGNPHG
jgi:AcrR family transcriptional regulator